VNTKQLLNKTTYDIQTTMKKTILMGLILAVLGTSMVASIGTSNLASAQENNLFGQEGSQLAQCEEDVCVGEEQTNKGAMGQHSSDETSGGEQSHPRVGIGNVGEEILGSEEKLTPSEVIVELCPDLELCP
jgi:hypothetical protein